ncbi:MAG: hypothetical protein Q8O67_21670 [Deltaproteobacteria bacterium]|nr:hypothetical protein [Deltaproteobacteria bacterium]
MGQLSACEVEVLADTDDVFRVELLWNVDVAAGDPTDLDVHLLHPTAPAWFDGGLDCHYFVVVYGHGGTASSSASRAKNVDRSLMRSLLVLLLLAALPVLAQSKDDRKTSLTGVSVVGIQESGVAALGGGTAGSPFLLQAEKAFKAAGVVVQGLDKINAAGLPIYNIHCTSMESGDQVRLACEGRLLRHLFLTAAEDSKGVYAIVWTSPLIIGSLPRDGLEDAEKITAAAIDALIKDWKEANPTAPKKK